MYIQHMEGDTFVTTQVTDLLMGQECPETLVDGPLGSLYLQMDEEKIHAIYHKTTTISKQGWVKQHEWTESSQPNRSE